MKADKAHNRGKAIRPKDLSKLGYHQDIARSLAISLMSKHGKHLSREEMTRILSGILESPSDWKNDPIWGRLAACFIEEEPETPFTVFDLRPESDQVPYKVYGGKCIDSNAKQQMEMALRLPIAVQGSLMPDAHAGYGLPIGGVLAANNAVIPYGVGLDIGCRMALTVFDAGAAYLERFSYAIKMAIRGYTHFGMEGGLDEQHEHEVLDREIFRSTELLRSLRGKAHRQLGTSGSGNHFVEFGMIELYEDNSLGLAAGQYTALLTHSGSRGLGANIAQHYTQIAMDTCRLPRYAQHLAWLDLGTEAGQEYWLSMQLAGDYAKACHDCIHEVLGRKLGLKSLARVENHHNFAWKETLENGETAIVHRKGATPAHKGELGIIPGNMLAAGYLVRGKGIGQSLNSASHGAGRQMSRKTAKESFSNSGLKKSLAQAGISLIGGSTEEAPLAYKDIETVMRMQTDLVDVEGRFHPRIVRMNKE